MHQVAGEGVGGTGSKSRYGERKTQTPGYAYEWEHFHSRLFVFFSMPRTA